MTTEHLKVDDIRGVFMWVRAWCNLSAPLTQHLISILDEYERLEKKAGEANRWLQRLQKVDHVRNAARANKSWDSWTILESMRELVSTVFPKVLGWVDEGDIQEFYERITRLLYLRNHLAHSDDPLHIADAVEAVEGLKQVIEALQCRLTRDQANALKVTHPNVEVRVSWRVPAMVCLSSMLSSVFDRAKILWGGLSECMDDAARSAALEKMRCTSHMKRLLEANNPDLALLCKLFHSDTSLFGRIQGFVGSVGMKPAEIAQVEWKKLKNARDFVEHLSGSETVKEFKQHLGIVAKAFQSLGGGKEGKALHDTALAAVAVGESVMCAWRRGNDERCMLQRHRVFRVEPSPGMIGRDVEMREVHGAIEQDGIAPVVISGHSGVGKSMLATESIRELLKKGWEALVVPGANVGVAMKAIVRFGR